MSGFITKPEVKANAAYITATWGADFLKAALAVEDGSTTFLALLVEHGKI